MLLTTVTVATVSSLMKKITDDLYETGKSKLSTSSSVLKNSFKHKNIATKAISITKVRSLLDLENPLSIYNFYYPSRLIFRDSIEKNVNSLKEIPKENYVIQGTAGQGKSIFLRYLFAQELKEETTTGRIPIFVELKRVAKEKDIKATIFESFSKLGFDIDDSLLDFYTSSGKFVLLLDAFDEMAEDQVNNTIDFIENLIINSGVQVIVTSRPDYDIQKSVLFRIIKLAPLKEKDHKPFLEKICNSEQADNLVKAIRENTSEVKDLLTTPLLMTLLFILYRTQQSIPKNIPKFYEELFDVMFYRHDNYKIGVTRKRHTNLDEGQVKKLFEAFCFNVRLRQYNLINNTKFKECLDPATKTLGINVSAEGFKKELVKVACMMQEEGFELSFIHKSVAEFHSASFVRDSIDEFAEKFYSKLYASERWSDWEMELRFLSQIDGYRYSNSFLIPALDAALKIFDVDTSKQNALLDLDFFKNRFFSLHLLGEALEGKFQPMAFSYDSELTYAVRMFITDWLADITYNGLIQEIPMNEELKAKGLNEKYGYEFSVYDFYNIPVYVDLVQGSYALALKNLKSLKEAAAKEMNQRRSALELISMFD